MQKQSYNTTVTEASSRTDDQDGILTLAMLVLLFTVAVPATALSQFLLWVLT